ncbi:unnamed protein product [Cyprideis torosa]|uniref:Uncharacterized protein n=1 Tax=Cyprideis torosa TaxID=163714 RepID=A0A7R8ZKH0_9CRUS|nr:unnamed protein product [Cyprideis torosa]CAG0884438.1 unnamed protein product [Cyprideis torosa]
MMPQRERPGMGEPESSVVLSSAEWTEVNKWCGKRLASGTWRVGRRTCPSPFANTSASSPPRGIPSEACRGVRRDGNVQEPSFVGPLKNVTSVIKRNATFTCMVEHLGQYKVAWIKADNKAIQALHKQVITNNNRVSVTHTGNRTWRLHISNVQPSDRGQYMCQINTAPMKVLGAYLDVHVPPDIISTESSRDISVPEGSTKELHCRAKGYPEPVVKWRREDNQDLTVYDNKQTRKVKEFVGDTLVLREIHRSEMGTYLCIATNGVAPTVSKRFSVSVHFAPTVTAERQVVGAPLHATVVLECRIEASPKSLNIWFREDGTVVANKPGKFETQEASIPGRLAIRLTLTINRLTKRDFGAYICRGQNSFGSTEAKIDLHQARSSRKHRPRPPELYLPKEHDGLRTSPASTQPKVIHSPSYINELNESVIEVSGNVRYEHNYDFDLTSAAASLRRTSRSLVATSVFFGLSCVRIR